VSGRGGDGDAHQALAALDRVQQFLDDAALLGERGQHAVHQEGHIVGDDLGDGMGAAAGPGRGKPQGGLARPAAGGKVRQGEGGRSQLLRVPRRQLPGGEVGMERRQQGAGAAFRQAGQGGVKHLLANGITGGRRAGGFWHHVLHVASVIRQRGVARQGRTWRGSLASANLSG
jgi:hypothetical protein